MEEQRNRREGLSGLDALKKYELPVLGTSGILAIAILQNVLPKGHNIPVAGIVAMGIFVYLTRYIVDPSCRSKTIFSGLAALLGLLIVSAAQVLFLKDIGISNPVAAIVNMGLTGIFVSTVLYLYLLGGGMSVLENYGRRFNKNYKEMKRPVYLDAFLLFVYAISAGRHLLTLYMLKITG